MDGRPLPGFYYDEEKKKYFKIVPDHAASQDFKHSATNVRREQRNAKKRKRSQQHSARRLVQTIQRPKVLTSPTWLATHGRETGSVSRQDLYAAQARHFVTSLALDRVFTCEPSDSPCPFLVDRFVTDSITDGRVFCGKSQDGGARIAVVEGIDCSPERSYSTGMASAMIWGDMSSLSLSPDRMLLATVLHARSDNIYMARIDQDVEGEPGPDIAVAMRLDQGNDDLDLWSSAANPTQGQGQFVIGGSQSATLLDTAGNVMGDLLVEGEEVRAVDWLSPSVAMCGTTTGVVLWDVRTNAHSQRFQHLDGVRGLRSMGDDNGLVAAGMGGTSLYDVRMLPTRSQMESVNSRTLVSFEPASLEKAGDFDIWPDLKAIARATYRAIEFHSLVDGQFLGHLNTSTAGADATGPLQVRFAEKRDGQMSVMAISGDQIRSWTCGGRPDFARWGDSLLED